MNLTADQMFEITVAIEIGLKAASLRALSADERLRWLAQVNALAARRLADPAISPAERQSLEASVVLAEQPDQIADRERERYYSRPTAERGRMRAGYKMAMNDLLSQSHFFSPAQREAIDARLAARGLPALRTLEIVLKRKHERILQRGVIRTDEDYYVVQEILANMSLEIAESDRAKFAQLAAAFEARASK